MNEVRIYSLDKGVEFGIEQCAMHVMKSVKWHLTDGWEMTNKNKIRTLGEKENFKYLGIIEGDTIKKLEMKEKIKKEYLRRTRKRLETKLSSRKLEFVSTNKSYMHKLAAVLENDTHKLLRDFDIQTDHLISARRPDLMIINNNNNKKKFPKLSILLS